MGGPPVLSHLVDAVAPEEVVGEWGPSGRAHARGQPHREHLHGDVLHLGDLRRLVCAQIALDAHRLFQRMRVLTMPERSQLICSVKLKDSVRACVCDCVIVWYL